MNIKQKMPFILIFIVILTSTALVASATNEINTKTITKAPTAAFTASPTSGYTPLKVAFTDRSTGKPSSWYWSFGDGTSSNEKNPIHVFNKEGKYTVTLTVKNAKGSNKITKYNYIIVLAPLKPPVAAFTASPTSGYSPLKVVFTDTSTRTPTSWYWNFGDGTSSIEKNPVHTYKKEGKYTVTLTVKNAKGSNKITKYNYIIVLAPLKPPVAAFTASPTSGDSPLKVAFNDASTGTSTSWYWSFGDGTSSNEKNPIHTYSKYGKYTVTLTVKNLKGSNKITKYNYIVVLKPTTVLPVANFSSNVTNGYSPLSVHFNDNSINATSWNWDFGDGTASTDKDPIHTYGNDGTYNVTLTAKNANGNNKITNNNYITVDSTQVVDVVCNMTIYKITAEFTSVYKGSTYYFCWSGCKKEFDANPEKYLNIPVANFSSNVTKGYSPLAVNFTDLSDNAIEWYWDFGDGKNSTDENPLHIYGNDGIYNVTLTAKNTIGNNATTKYNYITVDSNPEKSANLPIANFSSNVTKGYSPLTVQFNDSSTNATNWNWDFGDGGNSTEQNPVHIYTKNGKFNVTLTAKNGKGNDTVTKYNYVTVDSTTAKDLVCGMIIEKSTAITWEYKGTTYYFCREECKEEFEKNPEKYINSL